MSTPVIETIAANIMTTVAGVTEAAGYNQTLTVKRSRRLDFSDITPADRTALIIQADPEADSEEPVMTNQWTTPFLVQVILLDSDAATAAIDTRINAASADVHKAMMVDTTRGGYALDTRPLPTIIVKPEDGAGWTGIIVPFAILWRHADGDPYTKG